MLLFVSADGSCSFVVMKAWRTRVASQVSCVTTLSTQNMDKQLFRPRELRIEPGQPDAANVFNLWLRTVEDFISTLKNSKETTILYSAKAYNY